MQFRFMESLPGSKIGARTESRVVRILVVDDEHKIGSLLKEALELDGFQVVVAYDGKSMIQAIHKHQISLILLDINLPDRSGLDLVHDVRRLTDAPIVFVSARGADIDRIIGLEAGADDYIVKPFNVREVSARVRAVLRRNHDKPTQKDRRFRIGDYLVNRDTRHLTGPQGETVVLTGAEFMLLDYLQENAGRVCSREDLTTSLKGSEWTNADRSLDTLVARLRKKIEASPDTPALIITVRNVGYKLIPG